ncbi:MAG: DUF349 domain-containing protein [Granulosicoccaceae bacterium]
MFKKLFQRKPKASNSERQLERIETLDSSSPQHMSQLLELAKSDPDPNVRSAAASRIGLRDCLAGLLKDEQEPIVRARLVKLLFKGSSDEDAVEIATSLLRHADDDVARIALLADIQHPAAATFIATRIQNQDALLQTAVEHKVARVRLTAAQQLTDEAMLQQLSHKARDKSVNQWVRAQLKELKEQRHQAEQEQAQLQKLLEDCQQLAVSENPVSYRQRVARLHSHFQELAGLANAEQTGAIQSLLTTCEQRASAFEQAAKEPEPPTTVDRKAEAPASVKPEVRAEPVDPLAAQREAIHAPLREALAKDAALDANSIRALLGATQEAWDALAEEQREHPIHDSYTALEEAASSQDYLAANSDALAALCEVPLDNAMDDDALEELRASLKDYLDVLSWPSAWETPSVLQALRATHLQVEDIHQQRREQSRKRAQQLDKKIHRMGDALRRKNLRLANNIHREVQEGMPSLPTKEQRKLQQHLDKHLPEFNKLLDWHEYSAAPKKEELCQQMEALIEREQPPEARAESVKSLRNEWRTVTAANVQKDDPLWTRFNTAAEKAYAPCEPYFAKLRERKAENLAQRERLTGELEQFIQGVNWEEPPFDMLDKVLRTARAEWTQYSPVHFPDAKPCQKRFDKAMDKIHGALQKVRKANAELREQLIQRAKSLAEMEDVDAAIAQALKLQDEWKTVGPVTPQAQRKQWTQFRKPMDAVFARRQAARDASNAEIQNQRDAVNALLDQLEAHAKLPEDQLPQVAEELRQLQEQIAEASAELPKKVQSGLMRRQNDLLNRITEKQRALPLRRRARSYATLAQLAAGCQAVERSLLAGESTDPAELLHQIEQSQWQSLLQARVDSFTKVPQMQAKLADNQDELERLAIELEILAEVDTPEAFRGQRRAWQLDMLESGSGNDGREDEDKFFEILQRWHAVGAVEERAYTALQQRLVAGSQPFAKLLDVGAESAESPQVSAAAEQTTEDAQ